MGDVIDFQPPKEKLEQDAEETADNRSQTDEDEMQWLSAHNETGTTRNTRASKRE